MPIVSVPIKCTTLKNKIHVHNPEIGRDLKNLIMLCRKYPPLEDDKCISGLAQILCKMKGQQMLYSGDSEGFLSFDNLIKYFFDLDPFTYTQHICQSIFLKWMP